MKYYLVLGALAPIGFWLYASPKPFAPLALVNAASTSGGLASIQLESNVLASTGSSNTGTRGVAGGQERWRPWVQPALEGDTEKAHWVIMTGGLDHLSRAEGLEITRVAASQFFAALDADEAERKLSSATNSEVFLQNMQLLIERRNLDPDPAQLDGIIRSYEPQLQAAAEDYVAFLSDAVEQHWASGKEELWEPTDTSPYAEFDGKLKPVYQKMTNLGAYNVGVVIWPGDYPELDNAYGRVIEIRQAVNSDLLAYLTQ